MTSNIDLTMTSNLVMTSNIDLTFQVRSMANPPPAVKMALESICLLLGEGTPDWKGIRQVTFT